MLRNPLGYKLWSILSALLDPRRMYTFAFAILPSTLPRNRTARHSDILRKRPEILLL